MCGELKKMVEIRSAGGKSSPAREFSNALFPNNGGGGGGERMGI